MVSLQSLQTTAKPRGHLLRICYGTSRLKGVGVGPPITTLGFCCEYLQCLIDVRTQVVISPRLTCAHAQICTSKDCMSMPSEIHADTQAALHVCHAPSSEYLSVLASALLYDYCLAFAPWGILQTIAQICTQRIESLRISATVMTFCTLSFPKPSCDTGSLPLEAFLLLILR